MISPWASKISKPALLMSTLRDVHGGPILEPHLTVVGAGRLRRSAAIETLQGPQASARTLPASSAVAVSTTAAASNWNRPVRY
jgi:hypothetical protein